MDDYTVTVGIAENHSMDLCLRTLDSLVRQTGPAMDVVLLGCAKKWEFIRSSACFEGSRPRLKSFCIVDPGERIHKLRQENPAFRGEFFLAVATGMELSPSCIKALVEALRASKAAFAYPIFACGKSDPDFENYLPWRRDLSDSGKPVGLPVMFRTSSLQSLGQDCSVSEWFNPEICLQLASANYRGCLVPEILARQTGTKD